ncbi:MAG: nucleotidyltransferase family protein [Gammaproteobacteria bacterium]|nr:nucleotidyltransferase family protein [Gammaproteobacteria bacterium]
MTPFAALVLAGDRGPGDAVAGAAGTPCKALAPVAGVPMVLRVLDALARSDGVGRVVLCGPTRDAVMGSAALQGRIRPGVVDWVPPGTGPSASAMAGLGLIGGADPVLITTADHALLGPALVDDFLRLAAASGGDAVVGLVRHERVRAAFPDTRRTVTRFRDGGFCGTNLFAFPTPAGRRVVGYWQGVESRRKRPWRLIAAALGPLALMQYGLGWLSVERAMARLSRHLEVRVRAVELTAPEAGLDVDTVADLHQVEATLARRGVAPAGGHDASPQQISDEAVRARGT